MIINQLAKATEDLGGAFSGERISYALEMTLLGLLAVFSVLAIIWFILSIFKIFLYDIPNKRKSGSADKQIPKVKLEDSRAEVAPPATSAAPVASCTTDGATVAAIMAAISAYIADDPALAQQYAGGFRVVSFKRVRPKASWNTKNN